MYNYIENYFKDNIYNLLIFVVNLFDNIGTCYKHCRNINCIPTKKQCEKNYAIFLNILMMIIKCFVISCKYLKNII